MEDKDFRNIWNMHSSDLETNLEVDFASLKNAHFKSKNKEWIENHVKDHRKSTNNQWRYRIALPLLNCIKGVHQKGNGHSKIHDPKISDPTF